MMALYGGLSFSSSSELSPWDLYRNLSTHCELRTPGANVSAPVESMCRDPFSDRHLCRVEVARKVWETPCYAQSWQSCVKRSVNPSRAVLPATQGADSQCNWCSVSEEHPEAAYDCTAGASTVCKKSCADSDTCRTDALAFAVADPTMYFDPYWDLHCQNGGVRAWQWGPSGGNFNGSDEMLHGGSKCKCPSGWTGIECAQCVDDSSCAGKLGAGATCDKSLGSMKALTQSCTPLFGTNDFFWTSGNGLTTVNLHISRSLKSLQMMFHGQIDFPWNHDPVGWGQSNGFLGNAASFIAQFSECAEERHVACPKTTMPIRPADAKCMVLSCTKIKFTCPLDFGPDADMRFHGCAPHDYFPKKGTVTWACEELDGKPPSESFGLGCSFGLPGFLPWTFGCDTGSCHAQSNGTTAAPVPGPAPGPAPRPAPGASLYCSAANQAADPSRTALCNNSAYTLLFMGPLLVALLVVLLVLLCGGGCRSVGALFCARRCAPTGGIGSAEVAAAEVDAVEEGGGTGDALSIALLDGGAAPRVRPRLRTSSLDPGTGTNRSDAPLRPTRRPGDGEPMDAETTVSSPPEAWKDDLRGIAFSAVAVTTRSGLSCRGVRTILRGVTGACRAGELMAVMGPSGCGKTTLLDVLSGRKNTGEVNGDVRLDGVPHDAATLRRKTSMVFQDDVLPGGSTPSEYLEMHASLRPVYGAAQRGATRAEILAERRARMRGYIDRMGLDKCINTRMGDELTRGLSGGEKRRVSIASALLSSPNVLFLDEPTSGLDSSSAESIVQALDVVVQDGCSAIFSIHQPPAVLFDQFDRLLLLTANGRTLYSGPREEVLCHFAYLDAELELEQRAVCPANANPSEFLMDLIVLSPPHVLDSLVHAFPSSPVGRATQRLVDTLSGHQLASPREGGPQRSGRELGVVVEEDGSSPLSARGGPGWRLGTCVRDVACWPITFGRQVYQLTRRNLTRIVRRPVTLAVHYVATLALAVALAVAFPPLDNGDHKTLNAILERIGFFFFVLAYFFLASLSVVGMWRDEKLLFLRERDARCYSSLAYLASKFVCDILLLRVVPAVLFAAVCYYSVNLRRGPYYAMHFVQLLVATNVGATTIFFAISILSPSVSAANLVCILCSLFNMLFCGALAQKESFPQSARWIFRLAPMSYAYEGMMINEMVGEVYTLGYQLAGGQTHLNLPAQTGANLLSQQGLCSHYDDRSTTPDGDRCIVDFQTDIIGVWFTPVVFSFVAYLVLALLVKYRR